ncbi:hypothetical protein [Spirillospora sp. CA-294931]|uniref:hypothetical protein n=1 Tax=Spirillospora sp. CA-294931 TaxID=3240042 RepID=UPI003D8D9ABF
MTADTDVTWPFAVSQPRMSGAIRQAMGAAWRAYVEGVDAFIARHHRSVPRMAAALRLPEYLIPVWQVAPEQPWALVARPDVVISRGAPKIVDVNTGSTAGLFALNDLLLRTRRKTPLRPHLPAAGTPRFVMGRYADVLRGHMTSDEDLIAIACYAWEGEFPEHPDASPPWYYAALTDELARHGLAARLVHVEDFTEEVGGLYARGKKVGLVLRMFLPDFERPNEIAEYFRVVAAAQRQGVTIFTSVWGEFLGTKATLAALSDERFTDEMPPGLAGRLRQTVPWTRVVEARHTLWRDRRVDLPEWTVENQEQLVLKPALGGRGKGVLIGRETEPGAWAATVQEALAGGAAPWLVQDLLPPDHEQIAYLDAEDALTVVDGPSVYGAFVLDGEFVGAMRRHSPHGAEKLMINRSSGAVHSPVYWSDPA